MLHIANPTRIFGRPGGRKVTRFLGPIRPHAQAFPFVFRASFVALRAVQPYQVSRGFKGFLLGIAGGTFTFSIAPSTYRVLRKRYEDFCCMSYFRVPISTLCQPFQVPSGFKVDSAVARRAISTPTSLSLFVQSV